MLALATVGFAINFWAWALLSPLGPRFKDLLDLSGSQQALLVAVPVLVGSLGRIPVGALTDRFGGRVMFPLVVARHHRAGPVHRPVRSVTPCGAARRRLLPRHRRHRVRRRRAVRQRLVPAGAARPRHRRLRRRHGRYRDQRAHDRQAGQARVAQTPFLLTAVGPRRLRRRRLAVPAGRTRAGVMPTQSWPGASLPRPGCPITWQACILYAVAFGGYVAFSVYLPAYLKTAYGLDADRRRQPHGRLRDPGRAHAPRSAAGCPTGSARCPC